MTKTNFKRGFKLAYLSAVLSCVLFFPQKIRVFFGIFLAIIENSFLKILKIVGYFVQNRLNALLCLLAYYLSVGISAVISRLLRKDYLNLRLKNRSTFWFEKEKMKKDLERQF